MKKRKIIIRYENNKNTKENFVINSNTSLMKVPSKGERLNINKLQYLVDKVVTNVNLSKYGNNDYNMDEFDNISYYIKLIREVKNEDKGVQEKEIDNKQIMEKLDRIIGDIDKHCSSNSSSSDISSTLCDSNNGILIKTLEKIKSMVATTVTEYDLKELRNYIATLHGDTDKVNTNIKNEKEEENKDEESVEDTKNLKILRIDKVYRLMAYENGEYNTLGNLTTIQGYKFKTSKIEEGKVYLNNGYISFLDKIVEHKVNKYVGEEYNDIIIYDKELYKKDEGLNYYMQLSITHPDKVVIKTSLDDMDKYKNTFTLLNYHIRNK